jgi:glycosyltransferase involved in cell wall biosynthesis
MDDYSNTLKNSKVLIVTDSRVWSPGEGRNYRFTRLVKALHKKGMKIDLVTSRKKLRQVEYNQLINAGITNIITGANPEIKSTKQNAIQLLKRVSPSFIISLVKTIKNNYNSKSKKKIENSLPKKISDTRNNELPILVKNYLLKNDCDFIIVEYLMHAYSLDFLDNSWKKKKPITICDTHDVIYQRNQSLLELGVIPDFSISKEEESKILSKFDIIIAISPTDKDVFSEMLPNNIIVNCLPSCTVKPLPVAEGNQTILFVGGNAAPNIYGLRNFLEKTWNLILNQHPETKLAVVGNICHAFQGENFQSVNFKGFVNNLQEEYAKSNVVISPVTHGGGLKIKVLEALSYSRPVVLTKHSAIGFSGKQQDGMFVAQDWRDFSRHINSLLANPKLSIEVSIAAADYIRREFNEAKVLSELSQAIVELYNRQLSLK